MLNFCVQNPATVAGCGRERQCFHDDIAGEHHSHT